MYRIKEKVFDVLKMTKKQFLGILYKNFKFYKKIKKYEIKKHALYRWKLNQSYLKLGTFIHILCEEGANEIKKGV